MKANVLVISTTKPIADAVYMAEVEELDDYYKHLECRCMDVAVRKIGDTYFDIWVDDEGLLVDSPKVSAIRQTDSGFEPMLAGNLLIAHHDDVGNTTSISFEEANMIIDHIGIIKHDDEHEAPCLVCEY